MLLKLIPGYILTAMAVSLPFAADAQQTLWNSTMFHI